MSLKTTLKALNGNTFTVVALVLLSVGLYWMYGCQSTVESLLRPDRKVTRSELMAEWNYYTGLMKSRVANLDSQDEIRKLIFEQANLFTQTGTISPVGVLGLLASIGAIGFGLDARRKLTQSKATAGNVDNPPPG